MMSVRKNLTEILLEVTNEEINSIARETHSRLKTKGSLKFQMTLVKKKKKKYEKPLVSIINSDRISISLH